MSTKWIWLVLLIVVSASPTGTIAAEAIPGLEQLEEEAFRQAVASVNPSVVRIETVGGVDQLMPSLMPSAPTTGVVVSDDGFIVTSAFNFASKPSSVVVTLPDGRHLPAQIVSHDRSRMLTLLKVGAKPLTPTRAAAKESVRVGQWAIAVGRTYDEIPNVSLGIVSALNRIWGKALQTDAKVSPANYGGPLIDIEGNVLGILVPLAPQDSPEASGVEWYDSGIGFAIPLEDVLSVLPRLKQGENLHPGLLGVTLKGGDIYSTEPMVESVRYNSPAQQAGLEPGDVIVAIDGRHLVRQSQFRQVFGTKLAGDKIVLRVKRGEQVIERSITLVDQLEPYQSAFLGVLPDRDRSDSGRGMPVRLVFDDSPAGKIGLQARDRITRFGNAEIATPTELLNAVERFLPGQSTTIQFERTSSGNEKGAAVLERQVTLSVIPDLVPERLLPFPIPARAREKEQISAKTAQFLDTDTATQRAYWAFVPENYNAAFHYGLLVWISPPGAPMEGELWSAWKAESEQRGLILFAPRPERARGWLPDDAEVIRGMVERLRERYAIDASRIVVHGYSDGGVLAAHLAFKHRDLFRGLILASSAPRLVVPENRPGLRFQVLFINGDKEAMATSVEPAAQGLRRMKYPVSLIQFESATPRYPATVQALARWCDMLDRI